MAGVGGDACMWLSTRRVISARVPSASFAVQHRAHALVPSSAAAPRPARPVSVAGDGDREWHARDAHDHSGVARDRRGIACISRNDSAHHYALFDWAGDRAVAVWTAVGSVRPTPGAAWRGGTVHPGRGTDRDRAERQRVDRRARAAIGGRLRRAGAGPGNCARPGNRRPGRGTTRVADPGDVDGPGDRAGDRRLRHRLSGLASRLRLAGGAWRRSVRFDPGAAAGTGAG